MSSRQYMKQLVVERLSAAAEEIFRAFEKTIDEYEDEVRRQRGIVEVICRPHVRLSRVELPRKICTEEQEGTLSAPPHVDKEENGQQEVQLVLKSDTLVLAPDVKQEEQLGLLLPAPHAELQQQEMFAEQQEETLTDPQLCDKEKNSSLDQRKQESPSSKDDPEGQRVLTTDASVWTPDVKQEEHVVLVQEDRTSAVQVKADTLQRPLSSVVGHKHINCEYACQTLSERDSDVTRTQSHVNTGGKSGKCDAVPSVQREKHREERPYHCKTCGKRFRNRYSLMVHLRTHTGEKPFSCQTCGKRFRVIGHLNVHLRSHTGEKPYSCQTCGRSFAERKGWRVHLRTHTGEKPYCCETCGKCFGHRRTLTVHMRTHTGEKPYSCQTCGKRFSHQRKFTAHVRTHTGEKPFGCSTCGKCFGRRRTLTVHMRTHTGEKPYSCQTCGKCFGHRTTLTVHMRTHTGEKPYSCQTCGKCFGHRTTLTVHMRTHTGEKPFCCNTCGKSFGDRRALAAHMRTHSRGCTD